MMTLNNQKTSQIIQKLNQIKILVIGDFMLDEYIFGKVERISPEAPVPVVEEINRKHIPGGAGNVLCNLKSLGCTVYCTGIIGNDIEGKILKSKMLEYQLSDREFLLLEVNRPTTKKTRIIAGHQQICRLDKEDRRPIDMSLLKEILNNLNTIFDNINGIIISDYDKGVVIPELIDSIVSIANKKNIPVAVDPQVTHFHYYKNVFIVTPNHHEAGRFLGRTLNNFDDKDIEKAGYEILERLSCQYVLITRGEKGMSLISSDKINHIPTMAKEVFDVTGAGDTVISILTATYSSGADIEYATLLSNHAAGIVVGKLGAATVRPEELLIS